MKKFILLLIAFFTLSLTQNFAQTCKHAMTSSTSTTTASADDQAYLAAATAAASNDATIEKKVCDGSGKVCFMRYTKDESGKMVSSEVRYDQATASFVNAKTSCSTSKACCSGKKACCAKGAKSCSKDKEVKADTKINN